MIYQILFLEFDIGDFYIVRKGVIDNFVQNKATGFLPPIDPETQTLELKFQSKHKVNPLCTLVIEVVQCQTSFISLNSKPC